MQNTSSNKLPMFLIFITYCLIEVFHIYLVKESSFVLYLVILFTLVRLCAFLVRAKLLLAILALFSCVFISVNYSNLYEANSLSLQHSKDIADNINNYSSRYWTNQDTFKELISKQEELAMNIKELPNVLLVVALIILIELSLVYLVATLKTRRIVTSVTNRNNQNTISDVANKSRVLQNVTDNKSFVTKGFTSNVTKSVTNNVTPVTSVTLQKHDCNKVVTKSKVIANIKTFNPYVTSVTPVTNTVLQNDKCNDVTDLNQTTITDLKEETETNSNNKQKDIKSLSKQDFINKYKIKESYYRVLKSRFSKIYKEENTKDKNFKINSLQQELRIV